MCVICQYLSAKYMCVILRFFPIHPTSIKLYHAQMRLLSYLNRGFLFFPWFHREKQCLIYNFSFHTPLLLFSVVLSVSLYILFCLILPRPHRLAFFFIIACVRYYFKLYARYIYCTNFHIHMCVMFVYFSALYMCVMFDIIVTSKEIKKPVAPLPTNATGAPTKGAILLWQNILKM